MEIREPLGILDSVSSLELALKPDLTPANGNVRCVVGIE